MFQRFLKWLRFNFHYLGNPPWDTGITPPEVYQFLSKVPPGKVLDLGCGTGTNLITLVQHGWEAWGVDFSPLAISIARKKLKKENLFARTFTADVSNLSLISESFDLILDIGCYHGLPDRLRSGYRSELERLLNRGGTFLLYVHLTSNSAFIRNQTPSCRSWFDQKDLENFLTFLRLVGRVDSQDRVGRKASWLTFQRYDS